MTRILQESLGGRCKTCLIATVSPSVTAIEESMSTLNYAQAANGIVNKPITTSFMSGSSSSLPADFFKSSFTGGGKNEVGAVEHWRDMECRLEYMKAQVEEAQQALARKHLQQQELVEKAEQAEEAKLAAKAQLKIAKHEINSLREEIAQHIEEKDALSVELQHTKVSLSETTSILRATQHTEKCLTDEANQLLSTLKQSINDTNELHAQLMKNREGEIERKEATKTFNGAIVRLFEEVSILLDSFASLQREFGSFMTGTNNTTCERLHHLREANNQTLDVLTKEVHAASKLLKEQIAADGGVGPTVIAMTLSVLDKTASGQEVLDSNRMEISSSFESLRDHLTKSGQHLNDLDASYQAESSQMLENLTEKLSRTDEVLRKIVKSTIDTLQQQKEDRIKAAQSLENELEEWEAVTKRTTESITSVAGEKSSSILETIEMLQAERARHDEINTQLANQRDFLQKMDSNQRGIIEKQNEVLLSQKEAIMKSRQQNQEFCEQFMSNVMNGVQDLLQKQMAIILDGNKESHNSFVRTNHELVKLNSDIQTSSIDIKNTVSTTNQSIQSTFQKVIENESVASTVLQDTSNILANIMDSCQSHQSSVESKRQMMSKNLHDSQAENINTLKRLEEEVTSSGKECSELVTVQTRDELAVGIKKLTHLSESATAFAQNDVIEHVANAVTTTIEQPLENMMGVMKETLVSVSKRVQEGSSDIKAMTLKHSELVESMCNNMDSSAEEINTRCREQESAITDHGRTVKQVVKDHEKVVRDNVRTIKSANTKCQKNVHEFTGKVIRPNEPTPEIEARPAPVFSEELSMTPADSIILQGLRKEQSTCSEEMSVDDSSDKENNGDIAAMIPESSDGKPKASVLQDQNSTKADSSDLSSSKNTKNTEPTKRRNAESRTTRMKKPRTKA